MCEWRVIYFSSEASSDWQVGFFLFVFVSSTCLSISDNDELGEFLYTVDLSFENLTSTDGIFNEVSWNNELIN